MTMKGVVLKLSNNRFIIGWVLIAFLVAANDIHANVFIRRN